MLICLPYWSISTPNVAAVTQTSNASLGAGGLALLLNGNVDDNYVGIPLPFSLPIFNQLFTDVYVGANSYLTFGAGSTVYSTINGNHPAIPGIHISASDNSCQRVYAGSENDGATYRIRYEGSAGTSGIIGSPTIVWEITFYRDAPNTIDVVVETNTRGTAGASGITNGTLYLATPISPDTELLYPAYQYVCS